MWDPSDALLDAQPAPGARVWVVGSAQRRFWSGEEGRRSRLELIADQVCIRDPIDDA
jgi:single-stranded DNA-binding protein